LPGENEKDQLSMMVELLGQPPEKMLLKSKRKTYFINDDGNVIPYRSPKGKIRSPGAKPLENSIKSDDKHFMDFLHRCLCWDPADRIGPTEALNHPWILEGLPDYLKQEHLLQLKIPVDVIAFSFQESFQQDLKEKGKKGKAITNNFVEGTTSGQGKQKTHTKAL
jgi:serine/threonine protein kinase